VCPHARKGGEAIGEGPPLFHAFEDEVDSVSILLDKTSQTGQDVILLAHACLGHLDRDLMIAGKNLDPVLIIRWSSGSVLPC
jgi:hypothetical protein